MGPAAWKSIPRRGKSKHRSSEAGCGPLDPGEQWERALGRIRGPGGSRAHTAHSLSQGFRCYSEMDHQAVTAVDLTCQRVILAPGWPSGWKDMRAAISLQLLPLGLALNKHDQAGGKRVLAPGQPTRPRGTAPCILSPGPRGEAETQTHSDNSLLWAVAELSGRQINTRTCLPPLTKTEEPGSIEGRT